MSSSSVLDSLFLFLTAVTTAEGYVKLAGSGQTISLSNIKCGADVANRRMTCTGSFTSQSDGRVSDVHIKFTAGATGGGAVNIVAELHLTGLDASAESAVSVGGTYRIIVAVTW